MAIIAGQINPANYPQPDYSGVVRSAQMQAQGLADIGKSISGVIDNFGAAKKEQKKVDAYNKASAKSIEAAITLGNSYGIAGAESTLRPFLEAYNDPNLSPIEKAALLDEGKAMVPNVFGRFDQSQANAIEQAQVSARNTPPLPEPLTYKREPYKYGSGELQGTQRGSDGQLYDENFNLIRDINAYAEGKPVEVYSSGAGQSAANAIDAGLNLPFYGGVGESPPMISGPDGTPMLLPPPEGTTPISPSAIDASIALDPRQARQVPGEPPASIALPRPTPQLKSRVIGKEDEEKQGKIYTIDQVKELALKGIKITGTPLPNGDLFGTSYETLAPQRGEETIIDPVTGTVIRRDIALGGDLNKAPTTNLKEGEALVPDPTSPTGTKVVQIPSEMREKAQTDFSTYIAQVGDSYAKLNEMGKAVSAGEANPLNYVFSTAVGQTMGRMFGEKGQPLRDQINTMAPNIINVIRQSTQMGSKGMDSNAEREFYIKAMGDPTLPIEANIKALEALDKAYGKGNAVENMLKNYPELAQKVNKYKLSPTTEETGTTGDFLDPTERALKDKYKPSK